VERRAGGMRKGKETKKESDKQIMKVGKRETK
jgi:hypothetical protein